MSIRAKRGFDALGKGEDEGKAPAPNFISKGLTRSRTDKLSVVSNTTQAVASGGGNVTAFSGNAATALKAEPEAKLSPAEKLETRVQPQPTQKQAASEKRAEAKAKGYEGEACGECGNFTLLRNGTCMKCDTCGGTTGCS